MYATGIGLSTAGVILTPFTFGASLGLTIAGAATMAAGSGTNVAGAIIKRNRRKEDFAAVQIMMDDLGRMDKIVGEKLSKLEVSKQVL